MEHILYLLSSFAINNYTYNWLYLLFAALGSWFGAFASMTFLRTTGGSTG